MDLALDRVEAVLKAAGLSLGNMVFVNPYMTTEIPSRVMNEHYARRFEFGNTPARATIEVSSLPGAPTSSTRGLPCGIWRSAKRCVRKTCLPVPPPAPVCLRETLCIVLPRMGLFRGRTAGFTPRPRLINCARPCAINSTTLKKRR